MNIKDMFRYKCIFFRKNNASFKNQWPKMTCYLQGSLAVVTSSMSLIDDNNNAATTI